MTYVGGYAGYNNLPIMGWLSDDSVFEDKLLYNSLVRAFGPINGIGTEIQHLKQPQSPPQNKTTTTTFLSSLLANELLEILEVFGWSRVELFSSESYARYTLIVPIFTGVKL